MGINIPNNFRTHKESWREAIYAALNAAQGEGNSEDARYWEHELRAFDRAHEELAEMDRKAEDVPGAEVNLAGLEKWLLLRDATTWSVVDDFPHGPCGLTVSWNRDGSDAELVATLEHEDSGYGPALWRYGLAVLAERKAAKVPRMTLPGSESETFHVGETNLGGLKID
jgi:hypothetical protein